MLHTHHKNGVKTDVRKENLIPLCLDCHRKQPDHSHLFVSLVNSRLIARLRAEQSLDNTEEWQDILDLADPGLHGVVDLLERSNVYLPEVGFEIQNKQKEVVAQLELAWPNVKIGVSIDKVNAVTAHKEGWKVYSMRHALTQFDELAAQVG